jgi:hypothetical protein
MNFNGKLMIEIGKLKVWSAENIIDGHRLLRQSIDNSRQFRWFMVSSLNFVVYD